MRVLRLLVATCALACATRRATPPARPCLSDPPPPPPMIAAIGGEGDCPPTVAACLNVDDAIAIVRLDRYAEAAWARCGAAK